MIQVIATTRSGLMPDRSARSSLSENARIDLPVRVRFRNQKSAATTITAVTIVIAGAEPDRQPFLEPGQVRKRTRRNHEALAVVEGLVVDADDEAHDPVHDEHHAHRHDHEDAPAPPSAFGRSGRRRGRCRAARSAVGGDADRQRQKRRRQREDRDADALEVPGHQDRHHRPEGHRVAVGEVREAEDAVDQRDAKRAERQLASVRHGRNDHEVQKRDKRVQ